MIKEYHRNYILDNVTSLCASQIIDLIYRILLYISSAIIVYVITTAFLESTCNQAAKMTTTIFVSVKEHCNSFSTFVCTAMYIFTFLPTVIKVMDDGIREFYGICSFVINTL